MKKIIYIMIAILSIAVSKGQTTFSINPLPMGARLPQVVSTTNSLTTASNLWREWDVLLTQSSTTAPTGTIVYNSLATITTSYVSTGIYQFTCNACFTATRTIARITNNLSNTTSILIDWTNSSIMTMTTNVMTVAGTPSVITATPTNGLLTALPLTIRVRQ